MRRNGSVVFASFLGMLAVCVVNRSTAAETARSISLAGEWAIRLDPEKRGMEAKWFTGTLPPGPAGQWGKGQLPGSTDECKLGTPNQAKPTLAGLYRLFTYEGPAWYQRDIEIPADWQGKRVRLFLERTHWETCVWVDDQWFGTENTLIAPHLYDLGTSLAPGKHRLTICVDNTRKLNLGAFPSILYEGTQTNWNGLIGRLELQAMDPVAIDDLQVYPDLDQDRVLIDVTIANITGKPARRKLILNATHRKSGFRSITVTVSFTAEKSTNTVRAALPLGARAAGADVFLWDEFSPALYDLTVSLEAKQPASSDRRTVTFGMRKLAVEGSRFTMNGRPLMLRGTLECAIFPLTGYPSMDVPSWQSIYRIIKSYGLNHMRFHTWCPPEAAFAAADLEGVMLQVEGPFGNARDVGKAAKRDAFLEAEYLRIVRTYGNHPSFCLMTPGNEFPGPDALLSHWVDMLKKEDPRHLYSSPSDSPHSLTANRQFTVTSGGCRGVQGTGTDVDFRAAVEAENRPVMGHEIGQWTFYPNFDEIAKYTGVLAARNFEIVRNDLAAKHLLDLAPRYFQATGKQAVLLYKEEIELVLRTPGYAGFQLLDLHDYPGQGTALIGVLDPFWDSKGCVKPEVHSRYCGPTVPLLRTKKRVFTVDEPFTATAEIAHFGPRDLPGAQPQWTIKDSEGREVASGLLKKLDVPTGKLTSLGSFTASLKQSAAPSKLTVTVSIKDTPYVNDWEIWVYPSQETPAKPASVEIVGRWSNAKRLLAEGKRVLMFPEKEPHAKALRGSFRPTFWSPVWFAVQEPDTMSILCDPQHPALAQFPTDFYTNWQWYELLENSQSFILDDTPADFRPIVQVIDNFARNHKLGNLFEARVGQGSLLVCAIDLPRLADKHPAARQLLASLYAYIGSEGFRPAKELNARTFDSIFSPSMTKKVADKRQQPPITSAHSQHGTGQAGGQVWPSQPPKGCPFEPSHSIGAIRFTGVHSDYHCGDTWYPCWASDGNLYSPWTDGKTADLECSSVGEKACTANSVMIGDDPLHLKIENTSPLQPASPLPYGGRYPCGSLVYDGIWYYGTYCLGPSSPVVEHEGHLYNWPVLGPMPGFRISKDFGKTWTPSPLSPERPLFPEPRQFMGPVKMGCPHFVDFGKNLEHSPDGNAYLVGMGAEECDPQPRFANLSWITADQVYLARVTPGIENINDIAKYEFFAGHDGQGKPLWTNDFARIKPLLDWNNNMGCVTVTYNAPLKKYLMCVTDGWPTVARMNSYVLEADAITGPWRLVVYMKEFGEGGYFLNFPSKFISRDGKTLWLCYSAFYNYARNTTKMAINPPGGRYGLCMHEVQLLTGNRTIKKEQCP